MEQKFVFDYESYSALKDMSAGDLELVQRAKEACASAYAPYSKFQVGAAARLRSGVIITGSNQESEVFPAGVCAERSMLYYYQAHHADDPIEVIAIASMPDERECYPCGVCRQVINDTESRQSSPIRVIMSGRDSATAIDTARKLLPFTFKL